VWENLRGQVYMGSDGFITRHVPDGSIALREIPREQRLISRPSLGDVFGSAPRERGIVTAYREYGYKLKEIADFLGVHYSTVSRRLHEQEMSAP
jgi:putative transposase